MVASHNADEGFYFIDPDTQNNSAYGTYLLNTILSQASLEAMKHATGSLYPSISDGPSSLSYHDTVGRANLTFGDY